MAAISPDIIRNPYIGTNGNWYVWDSSAYNFVDTGIAATGAPAYVHIRWGTSLTPATLLTSPEEYIGIASTDSATAPADYTGYDWYKYKGNQGDAGADAHVFFKYSDALPTQDSDMYDSPTDATFYIGVYSSTEATPPTTHASYTWFRAKGLKGDDYTPFYGTAITGTSTTPSTYATGIELAEIGDRYLYNGSTDSEVGNEYICTLEGNASTALWRYLRNTRGPAGSGNVNSVDSVMPDAGGDVALSALRYIVQTLTAPQIAQVFANLGLGDSATKTVGTAAGNVPVLDGDGKLADSVISSYSLSEKMADVSSKADLVTLTTAEKGDWTNVIGDANPANDGPYSLSGSDPTVLPNWYRMYAPGLVYSVNGNIGAVVITLAGLGGAALVVSPTNGHVLTTNGDGQPIDSGHALTEYQPKATITANTDAAPALGTVANNREYRCTNASPTTAPTLTIPAISAATDELAFVVIFKAPNTTAPVVTNTSEATYPLAGHYVGVDCSSGVFTPVADTWYILSFRFGGVYMTCYVEVM